MAFFTPSDTILKLVIWLSLALFGLMLALVFQIIFLRITLVTRTARENRFLAIWRPLLSACILGEKITLPALSPIDYVSFLKLWNHLQESLRGEAKARLNELAVRCGMLEFTHKLLHKNNLRLQLLAINTLGQLADHTVWADVLLLAQRPDPLISLAAVRTLFQIDAKQALVSLRSELLQREDWPTAQLAIMLEELGDHSTFEYLSKMANDLSHTTDKTELGELKRLLHLLEIAPHHLVTFAILEILSATVDDEVIAQCLKFLRDPEDLHYAILHLGHPNWIVRLQAVRAFVFIGSRKNVPELSKLLSDPVWWVRYRTAQTILELIHDDSEDMAMLRAHLNDRYALDMLDMVVAEKRKQ